MQENNEKKSVKKNYVLNLINQILVIIIPLLLAPYIARVLQPEGVGKYSFLNSIITYFTLFASLGFWYYAQREMAKYQGDKSKQSKVFWEIFVARCFSVGASLILNLVLIAAGAYGSNSMFMLILSINIFAIMLDVSYFFQGNEEFGGIAARNIITKVVMTVLIFVLVKDPGDLWIYILLHSLATLLNNLSLWPPLLKRLEKTKFANLQPFRHFKQVILLFLPTIAASVYTVLDKTLIGVITGSDAQNGFYEQAEKIVKCALTLITCLDLVMIPRNSSEFEKGNIEQLNKNVYKAFHFLWLLGIPMTVGLMLVAGNFLPWYLGSSFNGSIILLQILSFLILIIGSNSILGAHYLIPTKKDKAFTLSILSGALCNFFLNIVLIYFYGALGAAISTIIAELLIVVVECVLVRKNLSLKELFKSMFKPLFAGIVMGIVVYGLSVYLAPSILSTLTIIAAGIVIYAAVILLLQDSLVLELFGGIKNKFKKSKE